MFTTASPMKVLVAGSTGHTLKMIEALAKDSRIKLTGVLTPVAKPIGRVQKLTKNPVEIWAISQELPVLSIIEKIDKNIQNEVIEHKNKFGCDLLLVVDFGYFLPNWLLKIPAIAPVNVHPSKLPAWRGSSPGQRVILAGETASAISVILVTEKIDQGDIVAQLPFNLDPIWDTEAYYQAAFDLVAPKLAEILVKFATGEIKPVPQPADSPTPMAVKLTKTDSFVPWSWLTASCGWNANPETTASAPGLLQDLGSEFWQNQDLAKLSQLLRQASLAFNPWPKLWTLMPTLKGPQRLIIHETSLSASKQLKLARVQLEGKTPSTWEEIKNNWLK